MARSDLQALMDMTCIRMGWDNDLISHHKESARVGDGQNVLDVIIRQYRCTADQALSRAVAIRDRMMCRYLRLRGTTGPQESRPRADSDKSTIAISGSKGPLTPKVSELLTTRVP